MLVRVTITVEVEDSEELETIESAAYAAAVQFEDVQLDLPEVAIELDGELQP